MDFYETSQEKMWCPLLETMFYYMMKCDYKGNNELEMIFYVNPNTKDLFL